MKDMMGIDLETGQHIFYFCFGPGGTIHEEAEIILVRNNSIRVEFLGNISRKKKNNMGYGRTKGDQTNLYNTTGKVFVLCKHVEKERVALQDRIRDLTEENDKLTAEVEKIHFRSDIIDL
jgi:hypothetical protein